MRTFVKSRKWDVMLWSYLFNIVLDYAGDLGGIVVLLFALFIVNVQ